MATMRSSARRRARARVRCTLARTTSLRCEAMTRRFIAKSLVMFACRRRLTSRPARVSAVNQKVEPLPSALSTPISPPINVASSRQMARPRPVPPNLRVVDESPCWNARNSVFLHVLGRDADTGVGDRRSGPSPSVSSIGATSMLICPLWVNLAALLSRLTSTWRSRVESPIDALAQAVVDDRQQLQALAGDRRRDDVGCGVDQAAQAERRTPRA